MKAFWENLKSPEKKSARVLLVLLSIYLLIGVAVGLTVADDRHVRFYMHGPAEMTLEYGERFTDPGCRAVTNGRLFGDGERELPLTVLGTVDEETLGDYELRYVARYLLFPYVTVRRVHVVDTTAPELVLATREDYTPSWFEGYEEEGYAAYDLRDGDLTAQVQREEQDGDFVYTVTDSAGNTASVVRHPAYTLGKPRITLTGDEHQTVNASLSYTDPGFRVADSEGRDMSAWLQVEGEVVPWQTGDYELRYFIDSGRGEVVEARRLVTVQPVKNPDVAQPDGKTIYLTFDDGPGPYTGRLLDVLDAYNVKATFFVTCRYPDYFDMVGRAFREGHSIGVHSATHDYYQVYASEEAFFADFDAAQELIREQTGEEARIFRFPGGSSNTVSRFNPGIMSRLTTVMTDMGYQYFDWNVSSGDAGETTSTNRVAENIISGCQAHQASVVLQHDIKDFSVAAVERVIVWGLNNGYVFAPLDETSPAPHHKIAN